MRTITQRTLKKCSRTEFCTNVSFFVSKTVRESKLFSIPDQNTAETSQPPAQPKNDWRAIDRACLLALQGPWEKFGSARLCRQKANFVNRRKLLLRQDPLEAILVIFGHTVLILFESSYKIWKMTPLLCACAMVITLETQKCRKRAPRSVEFNFFINCDKQKWFSQNGGRRADLQNVIYLFIDMFYKDCQIVQMD